MSGRKLSIAWMQADRSGLHGVLVIEHAGDRHAEPADHVLDEMSVALDQVVAGQAVGMPGDGPSPVGGPAGRTGSRRGRRARAGR